MPKSKTHFPQVPVEIAKKVTKAELQRGPAKGAQETNEKEDDELIELNSIGES